MLNSIYIVLCPTGGMGMGCMCCCVRLGVGWKPQDESRDGGGGGFSRVIRSVACSVV